jgi:hypothetical protein
MASTNSMNISKFSAMIGAEGLASPNKFVVEFTKVPSNVLAGNNPKNTITKEQLNLMCESAALAGRTVQSVLDRQYGVNREVAYNGPTYTPITLTFLCSSNYAEKKFFDRWNNKIVNISKAWDSGYYDDYIGTMSVKAIGRDGETVIHHTQYEECYPKSVAAIELNHSTQNSTVRLTVEMAYAYWTEPEHLETNDRTVFNVPEAGSHPAEK